MQIFKFCERKKIQKCFFANLKVKNRKRKIENEKFLKQDFCFTCAHTRVRVKNAGKWVIFPDVDAVKRQEMPNLPLFSVSDGFKLENGIVIGYWQNKRSGGLKNGLFDFPVNFSAKNMLILPNYARAQVCVYVILIYGRYYTGVILT